MKKRYIVLALFFFGLSVVSCNNANEEAKTENVKSEDEISDEEFEKEMQELDEDVEEMDKSDKETQEIIEEKSIIKK